MEIALPNRKQEGWHWSDFSQIPLDENSTKSATVLLNLDLPLKISKAKNNFENKNGLVALNLANCENISELVIDNSPKTPLHLEHQNGCSQFLLTLKPNQQLTLFENVLSSGWSNSLMKIKLERGAKLNHYRAFNSAAITFTHHEIEIAENAEYNASLITSGGRLERIDNKIELMGEGAKACFRAAGFVNGSNHSDMGVEIHHRKPNCKSLAQCHAIVLDKARASFRSTGIVYENAHATQLQQLTKALLLSDDAVMNAKPELVINHDDVECSHGVAVGSLDPEAVFFLNTRGVEDEVAKQMLLNAFITELFESDETALKFINDNWKI